MLRAAGQQVRGAAAAAAVGAEQGARRAQEAVEEGAQARLGGGESAQSPHYATLQGYVVFIRSDTGFGFTDLVDPQISHLSKLSRGGMNTGKISM